MPLRLLYDPPGNGGDVDRAAGVHLQDWAAETKWAHPVLQHSLELRVQDVIDVAWMPGGCPSGEATFDLGGRATAEHLDRLLTCLEQRWAVVGVEVGVEHGSRQLPRQLQQHGVAGRSQPPRPGPVASAEGVEQRLLDDVLAQQGQAELACQRLGERGLAAGRGPVTSTSVTPPRSDASGSSMSADLSSDELEVGEACSRSAPSSFADHDL